MDYRIAVDTGGTFTDLCVMEQSTGKMTVRKVPSTPQNPADAIINGLLKFVESGEIRLEEVDFFIHGTTVATNTLLEHKGAKVALITTKGFKDVLEIGRQARPSLYNSRIKHPTPIVERKYRYEANERVMYSGEILTPVDGNQIVEICKDMRNEGIEAVAVCLLHSYVNPLHERRIGEIIRKTCPDIFVTLSCDVLPEFREYERMSTVAINAFVMPKVSNYVENLANRLNEKSVKSDLYIMQSNGGVITANTAKEASARTVLSGPAGGALAGKVICRETGVKNVITVDMGGTSLDICLIENERPNYTNTSEIGGYPIKLPMIEINTIGSGGGSMAWIDAGGALRVGPESAGAVPGPVCYCKGGIVPTVTDANIVLGRLNPKSLLGGDFDLDVEKAKNAIEEKIAKPLGLTVTEAACGIIRVVNANMLRGIRVVSVEKGYDPREFALVPFGGAGPLHGVELAEELGISEVIVPIHPGVTSAIGMLIADVRHDYVKTYVTSTDVIDVYELQEIFKSMSSAAFSELQAEGFTSETIDIEYSLDMRYPSQAYEICIPLDNLWIDDRSIIDATEDFHKEHMKMYGYNKENSVVEIVNIRITSYGKLPQVKHFKKSKTDNTKAEPYTLRNVYMRDGFVKTNIYNRDDIPAYSTIVGPAVIEQLDSTTLIFEGQVGYVDEYLNIHIKEVKMDEQKN